MTFLALYRKELVSYFVSPLFYVVAAVFLCLCGFFFYTQLLFYVQYGFGHDILGGFWLAFLAGAPYSISMVLLLVMPLLTMRLFAEERKLGTIELLLTYPVRDGELVAAKFAACATVFVVMLAGTVLYPWYVFVLQPFPLLPLLAGYLGLLLLGLSFIACGLCVSALTDSQVVAAIGTLGLLLLSWVLTWNAAATTPGTLQVLTRLSMFDHFQGFARGVIDVQDVTYFLFVVVLFSFLTLRVLEARKWRGRQWVLLLVTTTGLAGGLGMAQVLLARHTWRLDLTPHRQYTLSPHAAQVLADLDRDVHVTAFLRSDDERNPEIVDLLQRAHTVSPRLRYAVVDVNRNPAVARQYGIDTYASVVVESCGRRRAFTNPREDLLIQAILHVTRSAAKVVYFLTGHGEAGSDDSDRRRGYSGATQALRRELYDVRPLSLLGDQPVPADASVVIIAGPRKELLPAELTKLGVYVDRGGALLILLDPQSGRSLGGFLSRYGVQVGGDVVVDPQNRLFAGDFLTMTMPGLSDRHPVSAALTAPPLFSQAAAVDFVGAPRPGVRGIELVQSAPTAWRTPDHTALQAGVATFVSGRDATGAIPVGVSLLVESDTAAPPPPIARFVILGDADFANNFFLEYLGNKDLLVNAINWLAGEEGLLAARPQRRTPGVEQFFVSAQQGRTAFVLGTIIEPALVLAVGAVVVLRRRWRG